jgi:serine/threonine-protein kinase
MVIDMRIHRNAIALAAVAVALATVDRSALAADEPLAQQAHAVLKKHCYRCHGVDFKVPGMNVLDVDTLTADRGQDAQRYLVLGQPDASYLWQRVAVDRDMPPDDSSERPSDAEIEILRRWIEANAPLPGRQPRPFRSERDVLAAIGEHLNRADTSTRPFLRYFTLTNLYNNHQQVSDDEMRLYRAALSKLVNSLSWQNAIVLPTAIDAEQTIFAVDLRDLGWDKNDLWKQILRVYPYGLKHDRSPDRSLADVASNVYRLASSDLPYIRADWFIANASRPPLYHTMLELPTDAKDLEKKLNVDSESDFRRGKLKRAGFATSGVSNQNRLVDRHDAIHGAYWRSYDFKSNEGPGNLFRRPLGPKFDNHPFENLAFESDGGEMIFHLPNGLQGYFLTNGKGERIDSGPIEVVSDALKTSGTPAIVTGLSCMACHKHGPIRFKDTVAASVAVGGDALRKVQDLFPPQEAMDQTLADDEDRFLRSLSKACGPFLQIDDDKDKDIRAFPEPISAIAVQYGKDISAAEAAYELGLPGPDELASRIQSNPQLRELGLAPLANGERIKRETWQSLKEFLSQFHRASSQLQLGTPHRLF